MAMISLPLPRITIQFCTQCKWMLRAAYFAQELLSTFNTALGEVALQPSTGGTFIVELFYSDAGATATDAHGSGEVQKAVLWDRKAEGGFPETKELKRRVRDIIQPSRDLGHVDGKNSTTSTQRNADLKIGGPQVVTNPAPKTEQRTQDEESAAVSLSHLNHSLKEMITGDQEGEGDGISRNADGGICEDCN